MAEQDPNNSISGVEPAVETPAPSLREVAERSYDDVIDAADDEAPSDGRARDDRGRFAPKEAKTGEAEEKPPSPETDAETPPEVVDPAIRQSAPDHWSAEDRAVFERLPPDAKNMLMRRYSEMEADYTRKSQANASAVQTVNALTPIFNDPIIQQSLQQWQTSPVDAIKQWADVHKRAYSPDPNVKAQLMIDIATEMGFDPAKLFAPLRQPEPSLPPGVENDPAVRYLANQYGKTASEMQALRNELLGIRQAEAQKYEQEALNNKRWTIDQWADEKGPDGKPLRPDFNEQLPFILELFQANPGRDLAEAYEYARRMNPKTWESMVAAERSRVHSQQSVAKAQAANRGNLRGITSPVSKPNSKGGSGSLRDVLDASADEVGF